MRFLLTEVSSVTEIPSVVNNTGYSMGNSFDSFLKLIATLLIFVFVLAITYLCTKWIGNYQRIKIKSGNLHIIESIPAGNGKMICLVKAGTQYLVVAVGREEIHFLSSLTEEQLTDFSFQNVPENGMGGNESFSEILNKFKEKLPKK